MLMMSLLISATPIVIMAQEKDQYMVPEYEYATDIPKEVYEAVYERNMALEKEPPKDVKGYRLFSLLDKGDGYVDVGNFRYELKQDNGSPSAKILSLAAGVSGAQSFAIPATISYGGVNYLVTEIGDMAFFGHRITGIRFSEGLKKIGLAAFHSNASLSGELTFPTTLTYIGDGAFWNCGKLTAVTVPDTVTTLYENAFRDCNGLKTFTRPKLVSAPINVNEMLEQDLPYVAYDEYEDSVDSSTKETHLSKAAMWTDEKKTKGKIAINYGEVSKGARLDIIFVMDYSGSMNFLTDVSKNNNIYSYSRLYLQQDILDDAIDSLLGANQKGHDIRIGMTAFNSKTLWTSKAIGDNGFSADGSFLKHEYQKLHCGDSTYYDEGLKPALEMFQNRQDKSREAIVIFLGDGEPNPSDEETKRERCKGILEAEALRHMGARLYPIGIYLDKKGIPQASEALRAISYDQKTYYNSADTTSYVKAMAEIVNDITENLKVRVIDELSQWFKIEGVSGANASAGKVEVSEKRVIWDLTGEEKGKIHTLELGIEMDECYHSQKNPTNAALLVPEGNITAKNQPNLYRDLKGYFSLDKVDEEGNFIPDTEFTLTHEDGEEITAATDEKGKIEKLWIDGGKWTFVESRTNPLYLPDFTKRSFEITEDGQHISYQGENAIVNIKKQPKLEGEKRADKAGVKPGEELTYTIKISNTGESGEIKIPVCDYLPDKTILKEESITQSGQLLRDENNKPYLYWEIESLKEGESKEFSFTVTIDETAKKEIINTATFQDGEETNAVITEIIEPAIKQQKPSVKTGDNALTRYMLVLLVVAGAIAVGSVIFKKCKN